MICVLVMAAGASWEPTALTHLDARSEVVVLKRCVDIGDLLATAATGQADVSVLDLDAPGLDPQAVQHLRRHAVRPVAVCRQGPDDIDTRERAGRLGITTLISEHDLDGLGEVVVSVEDADTRVRGLEEEPAGGRALPPRQRLVAVWGPAGAPGRTTVAINLAAAVAARQQHALLIDADPYGGSVAQHLGVLDEASGLLSAARLAAAPDGLGDRLLSVCRGVTDHLAVLTGLPRADRWVEVRQAAIEQILDMATTLGCVVVDTGFSLEDEPGSEFGSRPGRNTLTLAALEAADEVVVVGSADPVGLARLARALVELRDGLPHVDPRVVVNRMRPTIGWSEQEIAGMVDGFARAKGLHFLPQDTTGSDQALMLGQALLESGEGPLVRAIAQLADAVFPESIPGEGHPGQPLTTRPLASQRLRGMVRRPKRRSRRH